MTRRRKRALHYVEANLKAAANERRQITDLTMTTSESVAEPFSSYTEPSAAGVGEACCAMRILENQPDLLHEKSQLEIVITKRGHERIFCLKFHCELDCIKYYWGAVKRENRNHSFIELDHTLQACSDSVCFEQFDDSQIGQDAE